MNRTPKRQESLTFERIVLSGSEVEEQPTGKHPETDTGEDEHFQSLGEVHNQGEERSPHTTDEGVQRGDSVGRGVGLVHGNDQDGVHVIGSHVVDEVQQEGQSQSGPNTTVLNQGVWGNWELGKLGFVQAPDRNQDNTQDQRTNDLPVLPLGLQTTSQGQWDQDTTERNSQWENESPHTNTPGPVVGVSGGNSTRDPGVDDVRQSWHELVEQSPSQRGNVRKDQKKNQQDTNKPQVVENSTGTVLLNVGSLRLDDGTNNVENNSRDKQFQTAKDIRQSGVEDLRSSTNDRVNDIDRG
ncbi:hypothetical protein WICPIJ_002442 [Wickerhamomyces pijperi]|uniref:Uncharacterized protein n=1 Tax=Wickerhamomyces pijperi TaxID=599730 RepID=A0A9P8TNZ1_WICPI|nr:hypothetical protein WICPIJ_002442 [Wickerhamomyces pijperi]